MFRLMKLQIWCQNIRQPSNCTFSDWCSVKLKLQPIDWITLQIVALATGKHAGIHAKIQENNRFPTLCQKNLKLEWAMVMVKLWKSNWPKHATMHMYYTKCFRTPRILIRTSDCGVHFKKNGSFHFLFVWTLTWVSQKIGNPIWKHRLYAFFRNFKCYQQILL